jgi:hypothetical protein
MYLHWSVKLATGLLGTFVVLAGLFLVMGSGAEASALKSHTTRWIFLNYAGLMVWAFVWLGDQARMRGHNAWLWLAPFLFAPLPTLMLFLLYQSKQTR